MEFLLSGLVIFFVLLAEMLKKRKLVDPVFARKILHIGAISVSAVAVYFINIQTLLLIIGAALPVLLAAVLLGFFKDEKTGRKSFGILYFAISFFALTFLFGEDRPHLVFYPLMILAWSDGLATVVGYGFGKGVLSFSKDSKTWEGSLTFFMVSFLVSYCVQFLFPFELPKISMTEAIFISIFLTIVEMLSARSLDNLWVPAGMAYWLLLDWSAVEVWYSIAIPVLAFIAFKKKILTLDGALAAALLGWIFTLNSLPLVIVFPGLFFVIGSVLSKLPGHQDPDSNRNSTQVFANGLVPAMCFAVYFIIDVYVFLFGGIAGFAFALSDTASSEIGVRMGGKHVQILSFKTASQGESGAVTLAGTLSGAIFSSMMASLVFIFDLEKPWWIAGIVAFSGVFGNFMDSLIGAQYQAKYRNQKGVIVEKSTSQREELVRGRRWVDNSMTNLLSSGIACLMALFLAAFL